ncbi:hypothetical protein [Desulfosporosinus sp. SB140]
MTAQEKATVEAILEDVGLEPLRKAEYDDPKTEAKHLTISRTTSRTTR